jgi:hypothetical protein
MVLSEEPCEEAKDCKDKECIKSHVSPAAVLGEFPARFVWPECHADPFKASLLDLVGSCASTKIAPIQRARSDMKMPRAIRSHHPL